MSILFPLHSKVYAVLRVITVIKLNAEFIHHLEVIFLNSSLETPYILSPHLSFPEMKVSC